MWRPHPAVTQSRAKDSHPAIPALTPPFRRNSLCKNSENPETPEKLPIGTANIRQKRHEIPTQTLISYDFECYFPTLQKARIVFTQTGKPESRANTARNAHIRAMAPAGDSANLWPSAFPSIRHEGARSARFIRWIPAFAGMARWGRRNGEVGAWEWRGGV